MNKSNLYLLQSSVLLLSCMLIIFACSKGGTMGAAREAFDKKEFHTAGEIFKKVYSTTKDKSVKNEACFKTAECYRLANDMKNAENWYLKTVKADPQNLEAQLRLAQALKNNQKFSEAIIEFNKYKQLAGSNVDARVDDEIKGCEYALKWKNEKTRYVVENVKPLNTKWSDYAPMWYKKDQLFFSSDREKGASNKMYGWTGNQYSDIYKTTYKVDKKDPNNIKYGTPVLVDKASINTPYNDATPAFDSRFGTIYYTQCNGKNGKGLHCRIYSATAQGAEWLDPQPLSFSTDSFHCGHPTLSKDGQILYFSSDMPGGQGGKDIWYVTYSKRGRTWGDPVNLGPTVNTPGDEVYPFIHEDGTLYFASNGHVTLGGTDIFYTKGSVTDWSAPINMKSPINSGGDDFGIILSQDKESGYLSSNREGGRGQDDIYRFYMTPLVFTLSGIARDLKTKEVLSNTIITVTNSSDTVKLSVKTDDKGFYKITLQQKTDYELFGAHEDYYDSKIEFQTTKPYEVSMDLTQDLELDPFNFKDMIKVEGIYYDLNKANIRADAAPILDSLVLMMNKYPRIRIELGSHTDCRNDSAYNQSLSQRRSDSAVAYLISHGIDSLRLIAKGYGESMLVNDCACESGWVKRNCTEEEHQMNRRTTVKFLDNSYIAPKPKQKEEVKEETKPTRTTRPAQRRTPPPRR